MIITVSIAVAIVLFIAFFGGTIATMNKCSKDENRQLYQYLLDDNNYITVTGTLDEFYGDFTLIDTDLELEPNKEFDIVPPNWDTLKKNDFHRDVTIGKSRLTVTFSKYDLFGDMPVVEIYMDGKCYLDYETGKAGLLKYIEDRYL